MTTQKELARILDRAAARSAQPATSKQCWFLAGLMAAEGEDGSDYLLGAFALSKSMASTLIDGALNARKVAA